LRQPEAFGVKIRDSPTHHATVMIPQNSQKVTELFSGLLLLVCRTHGVRRLFEIIVLAIFLMEILDQPQDSKQDKAKGNQ